MLDENALSRIEQYIAVKDYRHAASVILEMLVRQPASEELRDILGDVYFLAGDKVNAGRQWYFCSRNDPSAKEARTAFESHFNHHPALIYDALRINFNTDKLPQEFHIRIDMLKKEGKQRGLNIGDVTTSAQPAEPKKKKQDSGCCGCIVVIIILLIIKFIADQF